MDFMEKIQKDLNASMRAMLIDWLVEVNLWWVMVLPGWCIYSREFVLLHDPIFQNCLYNSFITSLVIPWLVRLYVSLENFNCQYSNYFFVIVSKGFESPHVWYNLQEVKTWWGVLLLHSLTYSPWSVEIHVVSLNHVGLTWFHSIIKSVVESVLESMMLAFLIIDIVSWEILVIHFLTHSTINYYRTGCYFYWVLACVSP